MSPHARFASLAGPALRMQPDQRLARLAGEGSVQAFEEIVRRYRARLVAFAAAIVPAHRAEDIVQESLTKVFDALRESETEVHLRPWLYTIVRNRALNAVRDERIHVELDEEHDGVTPPPELLARREEVAGLLAGIKALPEAQRQALVGRELEGLSHDEIALRLGTSPASVRGLIFRARTAVRHAAGAVIPLPALRWLLAEAPGSSSAGEAAAAGGMAAAGVAGAGGGGIAVKAGAVLAAGALAAGAGIGLRDSGGDGAAEAAPQHVGANAQAHPEAKGGAQDDSAGSGTSSGPSDTAGERDPSHGGGGGGGDGSPGGGPSNQPATSSGDSDGSNRGPGSGDDHSGPGGGGGTDDGGHGGPGTGDDDPPEPPDDSNEGPGGGDDDHSGPGGGEDDDPLEPPDESDDSGSDHSGHGGGDDDIADPA